MEDINLLSNLRCIKIRSTNDDLIAAINRAIATVRVPSDICVSDTEIRVNVINNARTIRKVL